MSDIERTNYLMNEVMTCSCDLQWSDNWPVSRWFVYSFWSDTRDENTYVVVERVDTADATEPTKPVMEVRAFYDNEEDAIAFAQADGFVGA